MNDDTNELAKILTMINDKNEVTLNPIKALPKESIELALKMIMESSDEITVPLSEFNP